MINSVLVNFSLFLIRELAYQVEGYVTAVDRSILIASYSALKPRDRISHHYLVAILVLEAYLSRVQGICGIQRALKFSVEFLVVKALAAVQLLHFRR